MASRKNRAEVRIRRNDHAIFRSGSVKDRLIVCGLIGDFDISPDGTEIIFGRLKEN
jgi:hypothetical protein